MAEPRILIEQLDLENYTTWAFKMRNLLVTKDLWNAVEGTTNVDASIDAKALAIICLYVKEHHISTLAQCNKAKEAWDKLSSIHKGRSEARKMVLHQQLLSLQKLSTEDVTQYVNRAKALRDDLLAAGEEVKAFMRYIHFEWSS